MLPNIPPKFILCTGTGEQEKPYQIPSIYFQYRLIIKLNIDRFVI